MAQHDYVIDNQASAAARADLNSLFQAIASQNSGATAPATTYANQIWYDTATDLLKMRNEANSGWITLGTVDQTNNVFNPNFLPATQAEAEAGSNNVKGMTPLRVSQAIAALVPAGTVVNYQPFTATGTWTKPSGIVANALVVIEMWGGGGGGGKAANTTDSSASGGGGGAYHSRVIPASALGATVSVTVGAGGTAQTANNANGGAGGTSAFGTHIYAYGGNFGTAGSTSSSGGAGGGIDDIRTWGGDGGSDPSSGQSTAPTRGTWWGGGGGGSTHPGARGDFGGGGGGGFSNQAGGVSLFGGNGGAGASGSNGTNGSVPAGGGGGARNATTSGAGGRGEVRVWTIG